MNVESQAGARGGNSELGASGGHVCPFGFCSPCPAHMAFPWQDCTSSVAGRAESSGLDWTVQSPQLLQLDLEQKLLGQSRRGESCKSVPFHRELLGEQKRFYVLFAAQVYLKLSKLFPEGENVQVQNVHKGNIQSVSPVPKVLA